MKTPAIRSLNPSLRARARAGVRLLTAGLLACTLVGSTSCSRGRHAPDGGTIVYGNIETVDARLSFKVPGRLLVRLVDEGNRLEAGALIARLDDTELVQEESIRQAEVAVAAAALAELEAGARPQEVAALEATLRSATAELDRAGLELSRQESLRSSDVNAERDVETARALLQVAQARVGEINQRLDLLRAGARAEVIAQARARLEQSQAAHALARTRVDNARLVAPSAGIVLAKHAEPGEFLSVGSPVVTITDNSRVWMRGYVDQTEMGRLKPGQAVDVTVDAFPGRTFKGSVAFISPEAEFTPKTVQTEKERATLVFRIKVDLDNQSGELKAGMAAQAIISPVTMVRD